MLRITNRDYVLTRRLLCDINISIHLCYTHSSVCGSLVVHVHICTMCRYKLLHLSTILFTPPFITAPCYANNRMRKIMALNYGRWSGKSTLTFRLIQNSFEQTFPLFVYILHYGHTVHICNINVLSSWKVKTNVLLAQWDDACRLHYNNSHLVHIQNTENTVPSRILRILLMVILSPGALFICFFY